MRLSEVVSITKLDELVLALKPGHGLIVRHGQIWKFSFNKGTYRWICPIQLNKPAKRRHRRKR